MERITLPRRLTQTAFFLVTGQWFFVGFLRCPFGVPFISCTFCPLGDCTGIFLQVPFIGLLLVSGSLFGRVFCGWICPLGYLNDVLGKLPKPRIEGAAWFQRVEPGLRSLKYLFLALVLALVVLFNLPATRAYPYVVRSPSMFNWESVVLAVKLGAARYPIRIGLLGFALLAALVATRFWCRYLCPFGALFSLLNRVSLWRPVRTSACRRCGKYPGECLQHTTPTTPDCIICGDCLQGCPHGAIELRVLGKPDPGETEAPDGVRDNPDAVASRLP
ncbi:MAG: 4Fe-4S binding protein [Kiritimatiellaeota bacterium]|nr:4Fe-4S binding protein [Kiritimatiellota bacterium]